MLNTVGLLSVTFNFIYLPRYLIRVSLILDYFLQWYDLKYRTLQEYPTTIRPLLNIDKKNPTCHFITVSEWVLYNAKWAIFHLSWREQVIFLMRWRWSQLLSKPTRSVRFFMPHWYNSPLIDRSRYLYDISAADCKVYFSTFFSTLLYQITNLLLAKAQMESNTSNTIIPSMFLWRYY